MKAKPNGSRALPELAILTMPDLHRPFRGNQFNFIDLIKTGKEMGMLVCVVTAKDINLQKRIIHGYIYQPDKKSWVRRQFPLPRVIYNRIPTRKDELQPHVKETVRACLNHNGVRLFNPYFFNKWTLMEWLGKAPDTKFYLPATQKLTKPQTLESFLRLYTTVYLKPVRGLAGKGIMKAEMYNVPSGVQYRLSIQNQKKSVVSHHSDITRLWLKLNSIIGQEEYIVQQGITLARNNSRPFDLRVLVQKNQYGVWSLTGIGARVAGSRSITTHVPRGGSIDDPERLLYTLFGAESAARILLRTRHAVLTIAKRIEKASGKMLGEMSMDLGVDTVGRIWFFEANSRPMKFDEPEIRKKSLERILQFSRYLSKQKVKQRVNG